jgi:hypothetical protein
MCTYSGSIPETLEEMMTGMWQSSNMNHEVDLLAVSRIIEKIIRNRVEIN